MTQELQAKIEQSIELSQLWGSYFVLVQREMEKRHSPLVVDSALAGGDFQGIRGLSSDDSFCLFVVLAAREK